MNKMDKKNSFKPWEKKENRNEKLLFFHSR